jgi:hypothetical protein
VTSPIRCRIQAAAAILLLVSGTLPLSVAAPPRVATEPKNAGSQQAREKLDILLAAGLYTRWPSDMNRSSQDQSALTLGVVGASAAEFEKLAIGKQIAGRRLIIRHFPKAADVEPCEILFVTRSLERGERLALIQQFAASPVLLAGETPAFCREGGSLSFHTEDGNIRFTLNHQALAAQKLTVDPRFARLARIPAQAEKKAAPRDDFRHLSPSASGPPSRPTKVRPITTQPHTGGNRR